MKRIFITIIAACYLLPLTAQDAMNRELTLEKEYTPSIRDANKINQLPELSAPEATKTQVQFSNYTLPYSVSPYLINFSPSAYFTDLAASNKRGYLNLGVSTSPNIDADLGYQILNTNKDFLSIYASNRYTDSKSAFLQNEEVDARMKLHDIWGGIDYKHYFEPVIFSIGGQYNYSKYNYYGMPWDHVSEYYTEDLDQTTNFFSIHMGVEAKEGADLFYLLNATYTNFKYKHANELMMEDGRRENRIILDGVLQKQFNSTWKIGVAASFKNYSYSDSTLTAEKFGFTIGGPNFSPQWDNYKGYSLLTANPYILAEGINWKARIGVLPEFKFGNGSKFYISPDVHLSFAPAQQFAVYIDAVGGVKDNGLYNSFYENRYASAEYRIKDSHSPLDATLGFKITPIPGLLFDLFGGYKIVKDEHFYANNPCQYYLYGDHFSPNQYFLAYRASFSPVYSDADILKLGAHIQYKYKETFSIGLRGTYYKWNMDKDEYGSKYEPYGKPSFVLDANIGYNVGIIPLSVALNYHMETGRKAFYPGRDMKNINDLSLRGNYMFSDSFSVFVSLNNLLFQKYDIWYGYPAQNFNLMGGLSFKF